MKFTREISSLVATGQDASAKDINTGQLIFTVIGVANGNDLKAPAELTMLAKTLLHLDAITKKLDPEYDPQGVIRHYAEEMIGQKLRQKFHPQNIYPALLDLKQLALDLPRRTREIVDLTAGGKLTLGIKLAQAEEFLSGMHKIANRITIGVVIAALLISSSLMMRVYPQLAVIGYVLASAAAFYLIVSTSCATGGIGTRQGSRGSDARWAFGRSRLKDPSCKTVAVERWRPALPVSGSRTRPANFMEAKMRDAHRETRWRAANGESDAAKVERNLPTSRGAQ